jgi:hypothetical protein
MMAPVETMVRTVREIIEVWIRAGDRNGQGWMQNLDRLMTIYNFTVNSAFDNKYSPADVLSDVSLQRRYKTKNNSKRSAYKTDVDEEGLKAGDYVRIKRAAGEFTKQSVPTWSYDVYQVMDSYGKDGDFSHVPLRRIKQVNRERAGVYQEEPAKNVEHPPPVHFSRLAHVKTFEVDGREGQTIDPPADTRWLGFFASVDAKTYTQRQAKEGDYALVHKKPKVEPPDVEPARQLKKSTIAEMRKGKRHMLAMQKKIKEDPESKLSDFRSNKRRRKKL